MNLGSNAILKHIKGAKLNYSTRMSNLSSHSKAAAAVNPLMDPSTVSKHRFSILRSSAKFNQSGDSFPHLNLRDFSSIHDRQQVRRRLLHFRGGHFLDRRLEGDRESEPPRQTRGDRLEGTPLEKFAKPSAINRPLGEGLKHPPVSSVRKIEPPGKKRVVAGAAANKVLWQTGAAQEGGGANGVDRGVFQGDLEKRGL